jgi:hypothetical protein
MYMRVRVSPASVMRQVRRESYDGSYGKRTMTNNIKSAVCAVSIAMLATLLGACATADQQPVKVPPPATISGTGPCCGPITPNAQRVLDVLNASDVEHLWQKSTHVAWDTGAPDMSPSDEAAFARVDRTDTHCSAYAAAIGQRLGVYMLRPPEHRQTFLASAQVAWFSSHWGRNAGWYEVTTPEQAQALANAGKLVVASYPAPDPDHHPGHIAIVRPDAHRTLDQIHESGLVLTQAGDRNYNRITERAAFKWHPGAWPTGVQYFAHET